ncbi:MAG TPA: RodZ domain-containing protein [Anaerolineales bacterium]|nr:RodZ domain-containing protein [Anaerolineales bacterium]
MVEMIGEQLRRARQDRKLSLEQAALATHIRVHYLVALEAGDFSQLPSRAQARGFLRAYAGYLGLDPEMPLAQVNGEQPLQPAAELAADQGDALDAGTEILGEDQRAFVQIGETLRAQREVLGFTLDDVERHTHVRQHYLQALEAGNLDGLPSPVQGRGMLNNYASFLGLDPDPLLLKFAEGLQARLAARQAARPKPRPTRRARVATGRLRRLFATDFLVGGVLVLFLASFVVWGAIRINAMRSVEEAPSATILSIAEALQPTPAPVLSPTPTASLAPDSGQTTAGAPPTIAVAVEVTQTGEETGVPGAGEANGQTQATPGLVEGGGSVQVYLTVYQRAWVRISVDGEVELEGRVLPGSAYSFAGKERIEILTGNGAALQVFFNQQDLGLMGIYGEVVNRVFTLEGVQLPTPTITPTPTASPTVTPTPRQTATPAP